MSGGEVKKVMPFKLAMEARDTGKKTQSVRRNMDVLSHASKFRGH